MRPEATPARAVLRRVMALVLAALWTQGAAADDTADALARAYDSADYQTDMPGSTAPGAAAPDESTVRPEVQEPALPRDTDGAPATGGGDVGRAVGMVALALVLGVIAYMVFGVLTGVRLGSRDPRQSGAETDDGTGSPAAPPAGRLAAADRLAQEGRHAEAIHMLLLAVVAALRERMGGGLHASATAREMVRRAGLPDAPGGAFRTLVHAAELTHFGGRGADRARYDACRDSAGRVLDALAEATP